MERCLFCVNGVVFLANLILSAQAMLEPIDFLALQSVRKSLNDLPGSSFFAAWDFTGDPCDFPGVYCNRDGEKVTALNLGDSRAGSPGLAGRIDPAVGELSALTEFTIVPGRIFGALPRTLSQLKELRFLAVSRNFISGEIPAGLGQLRSLQTLDFSFNQLTGSIPPAIGTLPALTNAVLCHNRLSGAIPAFASRALTRLDLKHNQLSGELPPLGLPPSLTYLSLSWNRLTGAVDGQLSRLSRLNYVDLSMNRFRGGIPSNLFDFPITSLQLQRNQFSGELQPADDVAIPTVDLSFNQLSGEIPPSFSTVQNLYLNNNRFTGQVPGSLVERLLLSGGGIQTLYLQHNYLTGIEIDPTAEIPASTSLCLQYNCMILPVQTPCPSRAGKQRTRPAAQCTVH
ncbi:LRR receptor-like serine/threonine-protein kinase FLS2 isoform X2 [Andrographis paniculata]|uniref:LRR receptor-like serine/threonine-protein kinase FLS2 isoform X2 n=1 Tax=Andrographis paniculata TaxID=175694 RepID=UPI0021E8D3CF|nr:LRR receptor-like serine/threonine-protein kinase FLS2 isoform X2 [Andrographis paniculata]XP_051141844.1 LRR receptor-like serine/threonine-protein kinase FLS2 isoform X2 [Andrographis paniculata]XP_051141845.1 LRR receptor-like serine/threonine-protein kinase FLS2 isoform X2 [Andrographis paniculata]XP_051141846.1 LRR receptor-like serine/threonine-protein kinase FLS2 isoform X2 [Andrographis paniculata]XP_051141847.1 LRR receptor-like serine/threonine-protein kinase FLS2 isoform X2 [Andro